MIRSKFTFLVAAASVVLCISCEKLEGTKVPEVVNKSNSNKNNNKVDLYPRVLVLGAVQSGKSAQAKIKITNNGNTALTIAEHQTSCPCVTVLGIPCLIAPKSSVDLTINVETAVEPDFRGMLAVEVMGLGDDKIPVFRSEVQLTVVNAANGH